MTLRKLMQILADDRVAPVRTRDWRRLEGDFVQSESHDTGIAGPLRIGRFGERLVAVEQVDGDLLAVRPLASRGAAREFVKSRLEAYERFWDG